MDVPMIPIIQLGTSEIPVDDNFSFLFSMPIYQTATFVQPSGTEFGPYDYTRSGNPTRTALETLIAGLENAHAAFAFASGMAALSAVTRLVVRHHIKIV